MLNIPIYYDIPQRGIFHSKGGWGSLILGVGEQAPKPCSYLQKGYSYFEKGFYTAPSYLNNGLLGYVTIGYIEPRTQKP